MLEDEFGLRPLLGGGRPARAVGDIVAFYAAVTTE